MVRLAEDYPVKIADVEIVTPAAAMVHVPAVASYAVALAMKYTGAVVRILPSNAELAGVVGTVSKVVVGDWYITDNPVITNAFRVDKLDVLSFPPGYAAAKKILDEEQEKKRGERERMRAEREKRRVDNERIRAEKEKKRADREKKLAAQEKKRDELEKAPNDAINNDGKLSENTSRQKLTSVEGGNSVRETAPPIAAEVRDIVDSSSDIDSLVGATVLINKGIYLGKTGVIVEKRSIRRVQLDTVPGTLRFEDVTFLEYADNTAAIASGSNNGCTMEQNDYAERYQQYIGARVKVVQEVEPSEYAGVEGRVVRVIILGDWYITDNPDLSVAFTRAQFDVIKYPPASVENYEDGMDVDEAGVGVDRVQEINEGEQIIDRDENESSRNDGSLKRKRVVEDDEEELVPTKGNDSNESNDDDLDNNSTGGEFDPGSPFQQESSEAERDAGISHDQNIVIDNAMSGENDDFRTNHSNANTKESEKGPGIDPLVGASIYIHRGFYEGQSGTLIDRGARGWCRVSGIPRRVQVSFFSVVDDGKVDLDAVKAFSRRYPCVMPRVLKPDEVAEEKQKLSKIDVTGDDRGAAKPPPISNVSQSTIPPPLLDPILLQDIPASLHHLPADTKIEIFNRKTGKIMRGQDAILLKDLGKELMDHAEYEPIVPPLTSSKSSITSRIGRSAPNVRVNSAVVPQTRVRASDAEGRKVLVTGGEHRGLSGTVDSCIPGGWFIVSGLFRNCALNVVLNKKNLALLPEKISANLPKEDQEDMLKTRIHTKAAELRLNEESEGATGCGSTREKMKALLYALDEDIDETTKHIENTKAR
ncbi:hypothetical protein ACHAW5_010143 [Stephanodiscus triporus]|uniref:BRK domain-containing protein n=1 Tax=Stephanodiscus triporus TaxID=2934178 RepID=A0ABD3NQT1_9STRA